MAEKLAHLRRQESFEELACLAKLAQICLFRYRGYETGEIEIFLGAFGKKRGYNFV
jgi:hypothetical protein